MPKTILSQQRLKETKNLYIGHIIIFCEGYTEKNYIQYFADIINKEDNKYTNIQVKLELAGGNAQRVLNYAEDFLKDAQNNAKYSIYKKYLVFDCDAPKDIQSVITKARSSANDYEMLISNYIFVTWLLMHFEDVDDKLSKPKTYRRLEQHLTLEKYKYGKKKNSKGIIRKIISNANIQKAIDYSRLIERKYENQGKNIFSSISEMNPYSNVHILVEQFLIEMTH